MYKVFVNEKKLSFACELIDRGKNLKFQNTSTFEVAVDLLINTSTTAVNIFANDVQEVWTKFKAYYKNIEAAGGIVFNIEGEVLFIYRLGKWDLPKGKMEAGESREITAVREVEEECSISDLVLGEFVNSTYHMYRDRENKMILKIVHWYKMKHQGKPTPTPQEIEGITKAEWLPQDQIKDTVFPNTFQNIKMILSQVLSIH